MEFFSIKPKEFSETSISGQKGNNAISALANLSNSFRDLLAKTGANVDKGFEILSQQMGNSALPERVEREAPVDANAGGRQDGGADRSEDHVGRAENPARGDDGQDDDRPDDRNRDQAAGTDDRDARPAGDADGNQTDSVADRNSGNEDNASENQADAGGHSNDSAEATDSGAGDGDEAAGNAGSQANTASGENAATNTTDKVTDAAIAGAGKQTAELALSGVVALAQTGEIKGQGQEHSAERASAGAQRENAIQGLTAALGNVTKQNTQGQTGEGKSNAANTATHASAKAQANANQNAAFKASGDDPGAQAAKAATSTDAAQRQAADLAKKVGAGNQVNVRVNVANEGGTVVSRPTNTLANTSQQASDNAGTQQNNQQASQGRTNASLNPAATVHAAPPSQTNAAQGQTAQAGAQAANAQAAATGADAKGAAQAAQQGNAGAQAASGGASEGNATNAATNANDANQAQRNAAAQAEKPERPQLPRQPIADQVSVQVTKAIKAGLDRINIQLKPESMGRIDVKLEVARDGQVTAVVVADNKDTLDLLKRDGQELARALQEAGLKADSGSLNFSLRGQQGQENPAESAGGGAGSDNADNAEDVPGLEVAEAAHADIISETRVDIRA